MIQKLRLDSGSRNLLTVAGLPLVDGVFATLLVSGSISGITSILSLALTVFAGAGSLAVLFSESDSRKDARRMVYKIIPYLITGSIIVALLAPVFNQTFAVSRLQYVAATVLLLIAFKLAEFNWADRINTQWILIPGLIFSYQGIDIASLSLNYIVPAVATVGVACITLIAFSFARDFKMNLAYVRRGSSLILMIFSASMLGINIPSQTGLTVFAISLTGSLISPRIDLQIPENYFLVRQRMYQQ